MKVKGLFPFVLITPHQGAYLQPLGSVPLLATMLLVILSNLRMFSSSDIASYSSWPVTA